MRGWASGCGVVLLVLALVSPARGAASATVESGALRATVTSDPWHLELREGRTLLSEVAGLGSGPTGPLGFEAGGTWFHATRVVSERRGATEYVATLATNDPLGRRIELRLKPDSDGVIALEASVDGGVSATGIAFDAPGGERFLGFGERGNAVDQRGSEVESYVSDGPYPKSEQPFEVALIPPPGVRARDDSTYFPIPWLLSSRGYGVLVDNDETTLHRLGSATANAWSVETQAPSLRLRFFAGPRPAQVLARFSARVGRQPPAAAPFYFGPWFQPTGGDEANLRALKAAGAPASVAQTYTHYLPCGDQQGKTEAERRRVALFHDAGLAVTTYFNPMICTGYDPRYAQARDRGVLTRNQLDQPYEYRYTGSTQFLVSQFDFSAPGATTFFGELLGEAVADGHDGWMEDFGEYTPLDAKSANGMTGPQMHNHYPVLYHGAAYDFSRRAPRPLARFNRSGWTGAARVSQIVWGGDPTTDWGFDGLRSTVRQGLTMGLSGVSLWGSDIGGFFALSAPQLTPELLKRWIQVGFASGVMRTQANGFSLPGKERRPQIFDPDVLPVWTRYARLRTQLYPYLAAAEAAYDRTGLPLMRHLALADPTDPRAVARDDEYMFGPDLLAAPVLDPGARRRTVYVPRGTWIDLWRSARYRNGSLELGDVQTLAGGRERTLGAALDELPLLVRSGAVLPLLSPDVQTLTSYGRGVVHLSDRESERWLLAWPRGASASPLGPGERVGSLERRRTWTLTFRGRRTRTYRLQASLGAMKRAFRPCAISVRGRRLRRGRAWTYDAADNVLRATFRLRSGRVAIKRC
jgi:alpha-glucosidase (family GH31 glycosyl hydrolase)